MPEQVRTRNKVIHISLNPHPDDRLTDTELEQLAREYLDRLGYGEQPYLVFKHEDISRHHLHIVSVNVDENGRRLNRDFIHRRSKCITSELEKKYGCIRLTAASSAPTIPYGKWTHRRAT